MNFGWTTQSGTLGTTIMRRWRNLLGTRLLPINEGPISRSSTVLKPFSPVPTKEMTKPNATVPRPKYRNAFANELGPRSAPKKSSSSDDPLNVESCI